MDDPQFLAALESCALGAQEFGHAAHVRAGYLYSRTADLGTALRRMRAAIRNYAASIGEADRYHETVTVAYLALIQEKLCAYGDGGGWQGFVQQNPELLERDLLLRFYSPRQLHCALARKVFLLPRSDNAGVPCHRC
jgi:hypothetical protein